MQESNRETKRLFATICPYIERKNIQRLETFVLAHDRYRHVSNEWSAKERFQRQKWEREDRLDLLRAFPLELLSPETRKLRLEEERVFPTSSQKDVSHEDTMVSVVGARMTAAEMQRASDED